MEDKNHEDIDPGEPILEIQQLRLTPSESFTGRIRSSIHRRIFASDALDFSLLAFFQTMMDYLAAIFDGFSGTSTKDQDSSRKK